MHHVLAPGWHSHVGPAVHGIIVWQTARVLQKRGRTTRTMEHPRYEKDAPEWTSRERLWTRTAGRNAEDHRRGEERSLRRPRVRCVCSADARSEERRVGK